MTRRKYKSGTSWCIWRWTDVDSEYIVRLHLIKTPSFAICLHWILSLPARMDRLESVLRSDEKEQGTNA